MKIIHYLKNINNNLKNKTAFVTSQKTYSYSNVFNYFNLMIDHLVSHKVQRGQSIVLIADHNEWAVILLLAASALGVKIILPYSLQNASLSEWKKVIHLSRPDHVVFLKSETNLLPQLKTITPSVIFFNPNDLNNTKPTKKNISIYEKKSVKNFLILFSSGTTGNPKAISISEDLICRRVLAVSTQLKFKSSSHIFLSGLMNNTTGILFSLGSLLHQATLFFPKTREVQYWPSQIQLWTITHIMLRPVAMKTFIASVKKNHLTLPSLQVIAYGASALSKKVLIEGRKLFPCEWIQGYGLSETFGPFCWLTETDHKNQLYEKFNYCIGKPDNTLNVSLAFEKKNTNVGEITLNGSNLMDGYYDFNLKKLLPIKNHFLTGDYAEVSIDGYFILKGRIKNTVLTQNGHCIYPEEIENIVGNIPGVDEVALIESPVENSFNNIIILCVYGALIDQKLSVIKKTILSSLKKHLSAEKWPSHIYLSQESFPKNQNEKVIKNELLADLNQNFLIPL